MKQQLEEARSAGADKSKHRGFLARLMMDALPKDLSIGSFTYEARRLYATGEEWRDFVADEFEFAPEDKYQMDTILRKLRYCQQLYEVYIELSPEEQQNVKIKMLVDALTASQRKGTIPAEEYGARHKKTREENQQRRQAAASFSKEIHPAAAKEYNIDLSLKERIKRACNMPENFSWALHVIGMPIGTPDRILWGYLDWEIRQHQELVRKYNSNEAREVLLVLNRVKQLLPRPAELSYRDMREKSDATEENTVTK